MAASQSNCLPPGMPSIMLGVPQYPIEFLFTPGRVFVHHEAWMHCRNPSSRTGASTPLRAAPALDPTFQGESIGRPGWQHANGSSTRSAPRRI